MLQVAYGKTCPTLGVLLFTLQKNKQTKNHTIGWVVCFESQCLPRSAHLKIFLIFVILMTSFQICVYIPNTFFFFFFFFFTSASCLSSALLPSSFIIIYFLAPDEDNFLWLLQVAYGKTCPSTGYKTIVWVVRKVRKVRTDILFAYLVCFEVQCLPRSAHLKILLTFVILMTSF